MGSGKPAHASPQRPAEPTRVSFAGVTSLYSIGLVILVLLINRLERVVKPNKEDLDMGPKEEK